MTPPNDARTSLSVLDDDIPLAPLDDEPAAGRTHVDQASGSTAVIATPAAAAAATVAAPAACPQCGSQSSWGQASWCPDCGYYPSIGRRVYHETQPMPHDEAVTWDRVIPMWLRILIVGCVAVLAISVLGRLSTSPKGTARTLWTLAQALLGIVAFGAAHFAAYMRAVSDTDKYGPADIFMKPIEVWKPTFQDLPKKAWKPWSAAWGGLAVIGALAIVGGFRFEALFEDWGFKERAQQTVVQAILEKTRQDKGSDKSMEEALDDLAGQDEDKIRREPLDCVVVGYVPQGRSDFSQLHLASVVNGKVAYVGSVTVEKMTAEDRLAMAKRLPGLRRETPFVVTPVEGTWIEPVLMVRAKHERWSESRRMTNPIFDSVLADAPLE